MVQEHLYRQRNRGIIGIRETIFFLNKRKRGPFCPDLFMQYHRRIYLLGVSLLSCC